MSVVSRVDPRDRASATVHSVRVLSTSAGFVGIVASRIGLRRLYLPEPTVEQARELVLRPAAPFEDDSLLPELCADLARYFAGRPTVFRVRFDFSDASTLEQRVWKACAAIPYGETASYGELARQAGSPGAARAVGTIMRRNRCPIVVPCHRVIRSDGSLGGFSSPRGIDEKRALLEMERNSLAGAL